MGDVPLVSAYKSNNNNWLHISPFSIVHLGFDERQPLLLLDLLKKTNFTQARRSATSRETKSDILKLV